ncbi:MAG: periplasmic heavy metal sensor [Myxococcales bacterium]|nr:periplasmic heavy metal sensor [Myxococcales bacterium]
MNPQQEVTMHPTRIAVWIATATLAISLTAPAYAQPIENDGAPPSAEALERIKKMRGKVLREKVGLSEEKAKKVEASLDAHEPERRRVREATRTARKQLRDLLEANSDDQPAYDAALGKLRAGMKKMMELRDKQLDLFKKDLTPKEQAKLGQILGKLRKKMHGKGRHGGKGRRGGAAERHGGPDLEGDE